MFDLSAFVDGARKIVDGCRLDGAGRYRRWSWQKDGSPRDMGANPYGCADAANILYTIGDFPRDPAERQHWVTVLRGLQDPDSGMFRESTHHTIHTTAHCLAALELFDAGPAHQLTALKDLRNPRSMEAFLDKLDWHDNPWTASHRGAGLYAALVLAREVDSEWEDRYFAWLWDQTDPQTGFLRRGCIHPLRVAGVMSQFPHLAGTFHYLFNHEYARRPLRNPRALLDSCLALYPRDPFPLGRTVGFAEIDWVYCLSRSFRQIGHRPEGYRNALLGFANQYIPWLLTLDPQTHDALNDLHSLFGVLCCLAELQQCLPGLIRTRQPLKLVLDRRPFI